MNIQEWNINQITASDLTYKTGLEVFDDSENLDIQASIQAIQDAMYERNPEKYGDFLQVLKSQWLLLKLMNVPHQEKRLEMFWYTYYALRLLDDICDDDLREDLDVETKRSISYKAAGEDIWWDIYGLYDVLVEKILECASELWVEQEMKKSIDMIAKSLKFDFDRSVDTNALRNKQELEKNFDMMDILWTEYGVAVILWLDPEESIKRLTELWVACRIG